MTTLTLYLGIRGRQHWPVDALLDLRSDVNYTWLTWANGERMLMPRTLKHFALRLPDEQFVRLSRIVLVNREHIWQVGRTTYNQMWVELRSGERIEVAWRHVQAVARQLASTGPASVESPS